VYVNMKLQADAEPHVEILEADDCTRLHIVSSGLTGEQVLQSLAARGAALGHPEPGHVRIRVEWLRASAQPSGVGGDWPARFEQMLRYSQDRGWLEPGTQTLAAHISWADTAPGDKRDSAGGVLRDRQ